MNTRLADRQITALVAEQASSSEVITAAEGLLALQKDWTRIVQGMPSKSPLQDWKYLLCWWQTFVQSVDSQLRVLVIREGEQIVAIFPFFMETRSKLSPMQRRLRPFGYSGRLEPYDLTEEPLVAIASGYEQRSVDVAVQWLQSGLHAGLWDCCILNWFGESKPRLRNREWIRFTAKPGPAYVSLPSDWAAFKKTLTRSMRDNLPYYGRLLTREGHTWQIEVADLGPDWQRALTELVRLHRLRACASNDKHRVDHLNTEAHKNFLGSMHDSFRGDTRSYIAMLRVDNEIVGAQLLLDDGRTMVVSYSGYDPKWSRYSPLLILQSEMIQQAIARGVSRLDLLCGRAQWQERWQPTRDFPINKLILASKSLLATVRCINYVIARESTIYWQKSKLCRWLKRSRLMGSLQSCVQALYLGQARHAHLLMLAHRLRFHF